jgi:Periplasmic binding protein-like domain
MAMAIRKPNPDPRWRNDVGSPSRCGDEQCDSVDGGGGEDEHLAPHARRWPGRRRGRCRTRSTAVRHWLDRSPPVTGIVAYNDEFAVAVIAATRKIGASVPGDLAVVGVDNDPLGPYISSPLTTIDQRHDIVVAHLAAVIDAGINGEPAPRDPRSEAFP